MCCLRSASLLTMSIIAALIVMPQIPIIREAVTAAFAPVCYVLAVLTLLIILPYMRSYELTEEGITHRLLGIQVRHTMWSEIHDVARLRARDGVHRVIFAATGKAKPVRPGNRERKVQGQYKLQVGGLDVGTTKLSSQFSMWSGSLIVLQDRVDIADCIEHWHGKLDFDE
mgnify:CR=1 FL=1